MRQKHKKTGTTKINKNVKAEIATGIIILIAAVFGGSIWLGNKNSQSDVELSQNVPSPVMRVKSELKAPYNVVFLGDSITAMQNWNSLLGVSYITNAAISGNTTDDIKARLDSVVASKPKKLFLMMGVNDFLRGKDVEYVLANYETILSRIKKQSPDTVVYIQSVLPINNDVSRIGKIEGEKIVALNSKLKAMADGENIVYIDLHASFCGPDNQMYKKYSVDGVHLSSIGYTVWKNVINRYLAD